MFTRTTHRIWCLLVPMFCLGPALSIAADRAGVTTSVQTQAYQDSDFLPRLLSEGQIVYRQSNITTDRFGNAAIEFDDGSTLTVGPNSDLVIDEYVYNPDTGTGQAAMRLGKGVLRMVSGRIPSERVRIRTPVATVGIRGTEFALDTNNEDLLRIWTLQGTVTATINESGQEFSFDAPSYAECSSGGCTERGAPSLPVTQPPTSGQIGGESTNDGKDGIEDDVIDSSNL